MLWWVRRTLTLGRMYANARVKVRCHWGVGVVRGERGGYSGGDR